MSVPDAELELALDRLLADLKIEALELHRKGVPVDRLVEIALDICNARARSVLRARQQFSVTRPIGHG